MNRIEDKLVSDQRVATAQGGNNVQLFKDSV